MDDMVVYCDIDAPGVTTIVPNTLCAGAGLNIPYTVTGTFNAGNIFTAQLSDANGSFASPINIGSATSTATGTISATIPAGTTAGTGYRIRIVSSNPAITGADNGSDIIINAPATPSVSITSSATNNAACAGIPVTYTATPINGGTPSYAWTKGGTPVGGNSNTYTDNNPANNNVVSVSMTGNAACATITTPVTSNTITLTVNPIPAPAVSITSNAPGNSTCNGSQVLYTATPTDGGTAPVYEWKKGTTVVGTNSATFNDPTPANGDVITVTMTEIGRAHV